MRNIKKAFSGLVVVTVSSMSIVFSAQAQYGCSAQDQQAIQAYSQQMAQAYFSGNLQYVIQLTQQLENQLSSDCVAALMQLQQQSGYGAYGNGGYGGYGGYSGGVPNIYDHGGGTYSVPGGVTCGPSGCY